MQINLSVQISDYIIHFFFLSLSPFHFVCVECCVQSVLRNANMQYAVFNAHTTWSDIVKQKKNQSTNKRIKRIKYC